ncbi:hypothetical protein AB0K20_18030 [Micromonospora matsumotoense]|uniref:hypothetical protein n=1 Tax=Micromonospora matsumotoense TaxID=121616 RepID=UPI00341F15D6
MTILDCDTFDTALTSLASAIGVPAPALLQVLRGHDSGLRTGYDRVEHDAPMLLHSFGVELRDLRFDGAYYFHGSRVMQPTSFLRDGILPLDAMLDQIWASLYKLCAAEISPQQWLTLRRRLEEGPLEPNDNQHWARLYRHKVTARVDQGPFGSVIRDMVILPAEGHHDYLDIPEIVRDIAGFAGLDLDTRFRASTTSCVVKFRDDRVDEGHVAVALTYLLASARNEPLDQGCAYYPTRAGTAVPSHDIVAVDEIGPGHLLGTHRATIYRHQQQSIDSPVQF